MLSVGERDGIAVVGLNMYGCGPSSDGVFLSGKRLFLRRYQTKNPRIHAAPPMEPRIGHTTRLRDGPTLDCEPEGDDDEDCAELQDVEFEGAGLVTDELGCTTSGLAVTEPKEVACEAEDALLRVAGDGSEYLLISS